MGFQQVDKILQEETTALTSNKVINQGLLVGFRHVERNPRQISTKIHLSINQGPKEVTSMWVEVEITHGTQESHSTINQSVLIVKYHSYQHVDRKPPQCTSLHIHKSINQRLVITNDSNDRHL